MIISDNGCQFDSQGFCSFYLNPVIKKKFFSLGYPQANGQMKVTNRTLLKIIKVRLEGAKGAWLDELPSVLWAYQIAARTPTGETLVNLTYGTEAVIPIEIRVTSLRRELFNKDGNDEQLKLNLICLDEIRDQSS